VATMVPEFWSMADPEPDFQGPPTDPAQRL
jgi:hypothetical protein